jgi:hypothetical protein
MPESYTFTWKGQVQKGYAPSRSQEVMQPEPNQQAKTSPGGGIPIEELERQKQEEQKSKQPPPEEKKPPKPPQATEERTTGRTMTVADLSPEQKAEYDAIVAEEAKTLPPMYDKITETKARISELQKTLDENQQQSPGTTITDENSNMYGYFVPDPDWKPDPDKIKVYEAAFYEAEALRQSIPRLQAEYDAAARLFAERRVATAGITRSYTGASASDITESQEQTTILTKGGKEAFDYSKQKGLIPADAVYVAGDTPNAWSYTTISRVVAGIQASDLNAETKDTLENLYRQGAKTGDFTTYDATVKNIQQGQSVGGAENQRIIEATIQESTDPNAKALLSDLYAKAKKTGDYGNIIATINNIKEAENAKIDAENKRIATKNVADLMAIPTLDGEVYGQELANDYRRGVESGDMSTFEKRLKEYNDKVDAKAKIQQEQAKQDIAELRAIPNSGDYLAGLYEKAVRTGDDADYNAYKKAIDNYNAVVDVKIKEAEVANRDYDTFIRENTKLPDGNYMANTELARIKTETPKLYDAILTKGYDKSVGFMEKTKTENPKLYLYQLQQYGIAPENIEYHDTLPDGTVRYTEKGKDTSPKTVGELTGKIGGELATIFVPGVWAKDLKIEKDAKGNLTSNMAAWEIGLNVGTDLLVLIPVVGWGAKAVGRSILKAGTETLAKSIGKELPKVLVKAGERGLANDARAVAKTIPSINKAALNMEKAAIRTVVVVEQQQGVKALAKAIKAEELTKRVFVQKFQKLGADLAVLNTKVAQTGVSTKALEKGSGLGGQATDFAEYLTGSAKDLKRAELAAVRAGKMTPGSAAKVADDINKAIKSYTEAPKTIGEVTKATAITLRRGTKAGAAYLSTGKVSRASKALTPTQAYAKGGGKAVAQQLEKVRGQLAKEGATGRARAEKYLGKQTALDKWDEFAKDNWNPRTGGVRQTPSIFTPKGGVGTLTGTGESGTKARAKPQIQGQSYIVRSLAGKALYTVVTTADGGVEVIPEIQTVDTSIPSRTQPSTSPKRQPITITPKPSIQPGVVPIKTPDRIPTKAPGETPTRVPTKEPAKIPALTPIQVPSIAPSDVPTKAPAKVPTKAPAKIPVETPARVPVETPAKAPARQPVKAPVKTPAKTPVKAPVKLKLRPFLRFPSGMPDSEKRQAIKDAGGAFTWQQGKLNKKPVFHVVVNPFGPKDKTAVLGKPPEGAKQVSGKGQSKATITLTRGEAPKSPRRFEGGAVDPIVSPTGKKKVRIDFVYDRSTQKRPAGLKSKKFGRIFKTRVGRGTVLSRKPLGRKHR